MPPARPKLLEWAVASLPLPGEEQSGDRGLVELFDGGALLAVIDGLGHGGEAAAAAEAAAAVLAKRPRDRVEDLLVRCHEALRATRGVAMSLASIDAESGTMAWLGVGDVEGVVLRPDIGRHPSAREWIVTRGGVVGYKLPKVKVTSVALQPGDHLIFATDGVRDGFAERVQFRGTCRQVAERILTAHRKGTDDALVLVASYQGQS